MLGQATKDITREVSAGISFTHQLLSVAITDESLLNNLLNGETRHVHLEIVESVYQDEQSKSDNLSESDFASEDEEEVPDWFIELIPGLDELQEKKYYRFLPDGRALKLQADPGDELEEVWESVQLVLMLFILSTLLSNLAIYIGVRQGIKPMAGFLAGLNQIEKGQFTARLDHYAIRELNELSRHFNAMAHAWHHPALQLRDVVKNGRGPDPPSDMPAWKSKLSDSEIDSVIAWFQSQWPDEIDHAWNRRK